MFEPVRGGTRGGQAEFKWSDVSADKDRENYLGHSINAPTGRWQKNKDVHWYSRGQKQTDEERAAEIRQIKEAESEAMSTMLGFAPTKSGSSGSGGAASGANAIAVAPKAGVTVGEDLDPEKEEKRRRKEQRKEEKRLKKEKKEKRRVERRDRDDNEDHHNRDGREWRHSERSHDRSRSRSPRRRRSRSDDNSYRNGRARTPLPTSNSDRRRSPNEAGSNTHRGYDALERERERDRRRWDDNNLRRDQPGRAHWRRDR